ncbi:MAG: LCP family protein, partial [Chloroflexota bacterium]
VYDPAYSTCTFCGEYYPVEFEPGVQDMDGPRALEYARLRKSDNDYKRIERQQLVMRAIAVKATSLNLLDIGKAKSLYDTYKASIQTNVPDTQLPGLAKLGGQAGLANVRMVSAAPAMYPCPAVICGPSAQLLWNEQKMAELMALVFSDQRVVNEGAIIDVLNGTATPRLAGAFAGQMALEGISRIDMKTNEWSDGPPWPTTQIIDVTGTKSQTIALLKEKLGLPDARVLSAADVPALAPELEEFLDTTSDIIVVLGEDHNVSASFGDIYIEPEPYVPEPEPEPEPTFSEPEPTEPEATLPPEEEPIPTDTPVETEVPQ